MVLDFYLLWGWTRTKISKHNLISQYLVKKTCTNCFFYILFVVLIRLVDEYISFFLHQIQGSLTRPGPDYCLLSESSH